jgi:hypothetical protein
LEGTGDLREIYDETFLTILDTFRAAMSEEHGHLAFFLFGVAVDGLDFTGYVNRSS